MKASGIMMNFTEKEKFIMTLGKLQNKALISIIFRVLKDIGYNTMVKNILAR